ncbi:hypothetical protein [Alteromonas phage XX1924]|nr:hypothetical protein [Alteromonas phage XX1924]
MKVAKYMWREPDDYEYICYEMCATGRQMIKVYRKGPYWWSGVHQKWLVY